MSEVTNITWEDIQNKPFGEEGFKIEWDGTPTSEPLSIKDLEFYKVSDACFDAEDLIGSTSNLFAIEENINLTEIVSSDSIMDLGENCFGISSANLDGMPTILIASSATVVEGVDIPSAGIWFLSIPDICYTSSLEMIQIKKIDKKYLPDNIGGGVTSWNDLEDKPFGESGTKITWDNQPTDTIVSTGTKIDWDGTPTSTYEMINKEGAEIYFYKVSESVDTIIDGTVALTTPEGDSDTPLSSEVVQTTDGGENGIEIVNVKVANSTFNFDNAFGGDLTFKESGLYFVSITMNGQVSRVTSFTDQFYGLVLYKIHEPLDTLYGCRMSLIDGEETAELIFKEGDSDLNQPPSVLDSGSSIAMPYLFNIINDNETVVLEGIEISFVQAGLYVIDFALIDMGGVIFNYLALPDYKVVKIDKKFLPDDIGGGGNVDLSNYYTKSETDSSLAAKADLVNGKVPLAQLPDDIGGGVTSWNDLTDKPFYEVGTNITWDGNPTNVSVTKGELIEWDGSDTDITLEIPPNEDGTIPPGITLNKIAEKVDSLEGWAFTAISYGDGGTDTMTVEMTSDNITTVLDDAGNVIATHESNYMWVWNVEQAATVSVMGTDVTFPETGIYVVTCAGQFRVTTLCDALVHNMGAQFKLYKVQEPLQGNIYGYKMGITIDDETMEMVVGDTDDMPYMQTSTGSSAAAPYVFNVVTDNDTFDLTDTFGFEITFPEAGLYMFDCKSIGATLNYFTSPDYDIIKIDEKFLPEGIGAGGAGCPHYTGGYVFNFDENTYLAFNYYNLMALATDWNNLPYEAGMYNIQGTSPFIFTFVAATDMNSSNSNIIISIANKFTGDTSGIDKAYDSDVHVELNRTSKLQGNQWYTYYCVYVQSTGEWMGYLTNASSSGDNDTSELESKINSLERQIGWKQDRSNLVTSVNNNSTDSQYPSAKLLYDTKVDLEAQITDISDNVNAKQDKSNLVTSVNSYSNDEQYPSAKLLYDTKTSIENVLQFDNAPTANSEKLLKSGVIATALNDKVSTSTLNNSVNNLTTEINKKANQTALDTAVSDLITEIGKKANSDTVYTKNEIDGLITGVFYYKGSVDTFAELPTTAKVGDTYNVKIADAENNVKAGDNVVWCEIDGVGHWDVLSGIVDLSAYSTSEEIQGKLDEVQDQLDEKANKTDLNNYLTSTEIQIELGKKANKNEIPSLEGVAMETDLAKVALSNDYLDLDNKPFYTVGIDQTITYNGNYNTNTTPHYLSYYYTKCGEYLASKTVQEYIDGFDSLVYRGVSYSSINVNMNQAWQKQSNGIVSFKNQRLRVGAFVVIVPEDNLVYDLQSSSTSKITFNTKGIYCLLDEGDKSAFTSRVIFKAINTPLDKKYLPKATNNALGGVVIGDSLNIDSEGKLNYTLPVATTDTLGGVKAGENLSISEDGTISATSLAWDNVQNKPELYTKDEVNSIQTNLNNSIQTTKTTLTNSINTKVDKVEGSRLMTSAEGTKLDGIEENANNYILPAATTSSLGGVKVGANLSVAEDGTISATSLDWDNVEGKPELYTKSEVYNKNEVYNKTEVDTSLNTKQDKSNLVTNVNQYSTDEQYPSAKLLYTTNNVLQNSINTNKTNLESSINTTKSDLESSIATAKSELKAQIDNKQDVNNLVTSVSSNSTDTKYPSAKLLYTTKTGLETQIDTKQDKSNLVTSVSFSSTDIQYPSAKLLYTTKNTLQNSINTTKSDLEGSIATAKSDLETQIGKKQDISNLVTSVSASSTDTKYPSAKLLYTTKTGLESSINTTKTNLETQINSTKSNLETQLGTKQDKNSLVTSISSNSTDTQYPSAKLLYTTKTDLEDLMDTTRINLETTIGTKQDTSNLVTSIDENSTNSQYPSAKLLYDLCGGYETLLNEIAALIGE